MSDPLRELPAWTNHGVQMSKESGRSKVGGALTPELTGMTLHQQFAKRGGEGRTEGRRGGAYASHLRSSLVRAHVWTRIMYVGWCNLQPQRHVGLGLAWSRRLAPRREVRGRDGQEGASRWSCPWAEQRNTVRARIRCLPSNLHLQTSFFFFFLSCCADCLCGFCKTWMRVWVMLEIWPKVDLKRPG